MIQKILIVGFGSIGKKHLSVVKNILPNSTIRILRRELSDIELGSEVLQVTSISEANEFAPQVIMICNPASKHIKVAMELIETKAHLFIEKPIADSTNGVKELIEKCLQEKIVIAVGYNLRSSKSLCKFKEVLSDGLIGDVLSVHCEVGQYLPQWRPESDYRNGVSAKKELGGGVLLELSHEIDYLRWIFGEVDWVNATLSKQSNLEIDVEDSAHLVMGFQQSDARRVLIASLSMDFIRRDPVRRCTVIGDKGTLRWDGIAGEVTFFDPNDESWSLLFAEVGDIQDSYSLQFREFVEVVEKSRIPRVTGVDGLRVLEIIEAARKSSITGTRTNVSRHVFEFTDSK